MEWILNLETNYSKECNLLKSKLSYKRYLHSLSVGNEVAKLSNHFNLNYKYMELAALFHDFARELNSKELIKESKKKLCPDFPIEYNNIPILLHAPVSILLLRQNNIFLPEIYERAIIFHPTGDPTLSIPSLILTIADLIEEKRDFPSLKFLREKVYSSQNIFEAAHYIIVKKIDYSKQSQNIILNITIETLKALRKKLNIN